MGESGVNRERFYTKFCSLYSRFLFAIIRNKGIVFYSVQLHVCAGIKSIGVCVIVE